MNHKQQFKEQGISVLQELTESQLIAMFSEANHAYYNGNKPTMTDSQYDILKEYIEHVHPSNTTTSLIGASTKTKTKTKLPFSMPSMNKIKPDTNALSLWMQKYKGPYCISTKVDGVSGMLSIDTTGHKTLYTRGDGTYGQNISHLLPYLQLPTFTSSSSSSITIRGEFLLPKHIFNEKYKSLFANPRNLVSGIINSKTLDKEKIQDLHFVMYEIISPSIKPFEQMISLQEQQYEVVQYCNTTAQLLTNDLLSSFLTEWRTNYKYEIDGLIVTDNNIYNRTNNNPEHAFAFKMVLSDQLVEAKVVDVIWTPSKDGYLKPRVRIEPVHVGGVTIEYATGFNGSFIEKNNIGIGAIIQLTRSGDVIPYIVKVIVPAECPKMASCPYTWTTSHIDIVMEKREENQMVLIKNITDFFRGIHVDGLSHGNITRLVQAGHDTISKIIHLSLSEWIQIDGFKEKKSIQLVTNIQQSITNVTLIDLMIASNLFGRGMGDKKIHTIMKSHPDMLCNISKQTIDCLMSIQGIGKENATLFVENIPRFLSFLQELNIKHIIHATTTQKIEEKTQEKIEEHHVLYQKEIVMTKTREPLIINQLKKIGAILADKVNKKTFLVITNDAKEESNKTKDAKKHEIPIVSCHDFMQKYG